jgi:hypothetical protein
MPTPRAIFWSSV